VCPACGTSPNPAQTLCAQCGRPLAAAGGGLDLLSDAEREAADHFAAQYSALREREGWFGPNGREDPQGGNPSLWSGRLESMSHAVAALSSFWTGAGRPAVADIGAGGDWAARYLPGADVIAFDLLASEAVGGALHVRGDMRRLPLRDAAVDCALYAASLHYAPVEVCIREAARVLKAGGLIVACDSPMYRDRRAQAAAYSRSAAYYTGEGFPELAAHYHPIEVTSLREALARSDFEVLRLDPGRTAHRWWERAGQPRRSSFLVARLDRGYA
jgi:SAM-dependent methyltransferase